MWNNPTGATDPSGFLGVFGHYDLTYASLVMAGFPADLAQGVASAAWAPDTDTRNAMSVESILMEPFGSQSSYHLLDFRDAESAKISTGRDFTEGLWNVLLTSKIDPSIERIAHRAGDAMVHFSSITGRHFVPYIGHFFESIAGSVLGTDPDDPFQNQEGHLAWAMAAFDSAQSACMGNPHCGGGISRDNFGEIIQSVLKIDNASVKYSSFHLVGPNFDMRSTELSSILVQLGYPLALWGTRFAGFIKST